MLSISILYTHAEQYYQLRYNSNDKQMETSKKLIGLGPYKIFFIFLDSVFFRNIFFLDLHFNGYIKFWYQKACLINRNHESYAI